MDIFKVLIQLWKAGAEIYRDNSDGRLVMKNADRVPSEVMKLAEQNGKEIDRFITEFDSMNVEDKTMFKIHSFVAGWQPYNKQIEKFLNEDYHSMKLWYEWSVILAQNGYKSIYEDYRTFEDDKSNLIKKEIYQRAVAFNKGASK